MQTFVPLNTFEESAQVLDRARLGKQRVETLQILKALTTPSYGWQNHPAVRMWRGYTDALVDYGVAVCREWIHRGYADTCLDKIMAFGSQQPAAPPFWWGGSIHASHRAALLLKNPTHYSQFRWAETPANAYVWPV